MGKKMTVIGAGPGGYVAAIRAAQLGAEVTLIEKENVGGTCLNWGCIPSKVLKTTAEMMNACKRAREFGIKLSGDILPDMGVLMARKEKVVRDQAEGLMKLFDHHKILYLRGKGALREPNVAAVTTAEGPTIEVPWDKLVLAPGSRPLEIPASPFDGEKVLSSNHALGLREVPESLLIVGGGVIGCEFAFIFSSFGSRVTVVEALSRMLPLPSVDEGCSKLLQREMKKGRIQFMVNRNVERVDQGGGKCRVTIGPSPFAEGLGEKDRKPVVAEVDKILVCVGRRPDTAGMGLERLGVNMDELGWIGVNDRMETNVPGVYAIGDALGPSKIMLAHVASREGFVAAENAVGERRRMDYGVVPGAVFTMPEVADVGLTESQANAQGYAVRSDTVLFRNLGKAQVMGEIAGEAKIVSDAENGRILGVHIVGPRASDLIAEATLSVQAGCTVKDLAETIHAHPTLAEIMMETSMKALGRTLHG